MAKGVEQIFEHSVPLFPFSGAYVVGPYRRCQKNDAALIAQNRKYTVTGRKAQPYQVQPVHLHPSAEIQWSPLQSSMRPALRLH